MSAGQLSEFFNGVDTTGKPATKQSLTLYWEYTINTKPNIAILSLAYKHWFI